MTMRIQSEIREIENKIIANNKIIATAAKINKIIAELTELRAQQANINQTTESQKTASQEQPESKEQTESKEQHDTDKTDSQEKTESKEQHGKTDSHDKIDSGEQHDNHKPEPETSPEYYEPADTSQKKKPGESRASHEPPLPRIRIKICKGGEGGNHHRGAITVKKSTLETEDLPPFKEERQIRIADDLDSGQEPPPSREEPAVGLLTMRGLLAEQLFTVHEPFTANGLDSGQEPPSSKEEQQGGTGRDIDIGDIDSTTETESGAARMPAPLRRSPAFRPSPLTAATTISATTSKFLT